MRFNDLIKALKAMIYFGYYFVCREFFADAREIHKISKQHGYLVILPCLAAAIAFEFVGNFFGQYIMKQVV